MFLLDNVAQSPRGSGCVGPPALAAPSFTSLAHPVLQLLLPLIAVTSAHTESSPPCSVVVVGGGLAGLSAAVEATSYFSRANLPLCTVTLVDKEPRIGGNSAKASSGINAAHTPEQAAAGVTDSVDAFAADTAASGGGLGQPELLRALAEDSVQVSWLLQLVALTRDVARCRRSTSCGRTAWTFRCCRSAAATLPPAHTDPAPPPAQE